MADKTDFIFIERIFPLYRKAIFDIIFKNHKFLFFHGASKGSGIEQAKAEYCVPINSLTYGRKESQVFLFPFRRLVKAKPKVIIHEFSAGILSMPLVLFLCRVSKIKLIFWGHMYDRTKGFFPHKNISDKYRLWLWRKADSLIACSQIEKQLLLNNNIPQEKIFVAPNTIDTNTLLKVRNDLERTGKEELKRRLKFKHDINLVFIGRLYKEKKPELLFDLLEGLTKKGFKSIAIHYIGDGEMSMALKKRSLESGLENNAFFHGAIYDETRTGEILFCSDLMIMPGCVGLSVNHAFCFNCPVVTFKEINNNPPHGPEIEYIVHGKTGFLIADHSTDTLVATVEEYLHSAEMRKSMQLEIRNLIENICSVEKMAEGVIQAIDYNLQRHN